MAIPQGSGAIGRWYSWSALREIYSKTEWKWRRRNGRRRSHHLPRLPHRRHGMCICHFYGNAPSGNHLVCVMRVVWRVKHTYYTQDRRYGSAQQREQSLMLRARRDRTSPVIRWSRVVISELGKLNSELRHCANSLVAMTSSSLAHTHVRYVDSIRLIVFYSGVRIGN